MPQLRQNIVTGEWVVIAPERAKRPDDFVAKIEKIEAHTECIFCVGSSAHMNRLVGFDTKYTYTMPNKYPAFVIEGDHEVRSYNPEEGFYQVKPAVGGHDVIVVTEGNDTLLTFKKEVIVDLFQSFKNRYAYYRKDPSVQYVIAIYNHGEAAGASIAHPHAQIFATGVIPNHIVAETHGSERYYEISGHCVFCEIIAHEQKEKVRVLAENDRFIMFTFFASRFPFEMWILPKQHQSMYESITAEENIDLAIIFQTGLSMLDKTLKNPSLNFYIHSLPTTSEQADYYHWHLEIAPRVSMYAGFELGSGTVIDVVSPEKAAEFLRHPDTGQPKEEA